MSAADVISSVATVFLYGVALPVLLFLLCQAIIDVLRP